VIEATSLQGQIGRLMFEREGGDASIATAIEEHYKPQGPSDTVPTDPVAIAVALADKLDTLVGFWAIDEKPTGSKDPFALRRAALGVVRIILENNVRFGIVEAILLMPMTGNLKTEKSSTSKTVREAVNKAFDTVVDPTLVAFILDRLKVYLRDKGIRHDALNLAKPAISEAVGQEDYVNALTSLAELRIPIDAFFTHAQIITDDTAVRENNLRLLGMISDTSRQIADFEAVQG